MNGLGPTVLRALSWALLVGGFIGLAVYASDEQLGLGAVTALAGIVCWATMTTIADYVSYAAARLDRIEANTKRAADLLAQVQQG
jgi:uncharacterized membrane protein